MKWLALLLLMIGISQLKAQDPKAEPSRSVVVDIAGPPSYFLSRSETQTWRIVAGYEHHPFGKKWLGLTHSIEYLHFHEEFTDWWFFQYPFTPLNAWYGDGYLDHKQLTYVIGLRMRARIGITPLTLFAEPRLGLGYRWGRKMAYQSNASMDYDVHESSISPRLRAGLNLRFSKLLSLEGAADLYPQKYMGSGSVRWQLLPILNLKFSF
jgi:hypothetical protein